MDYDWQYPKMTSNCLYNLVPASPLTLLSATQLILVSLDLSQSSFLFVCFFTVSFKILSHVFTSTSNALSIFLTHALFPTV